MISASYITALADSRIDVNTARPGKVNDVCTILTSGLHFDDCGKIHRTVQAGNAQGMAALADDTNHPLGESENGLLADCVRCAEWGFFVALPSKILDIRATCG